MSKLVPTVRGMHDILPSEIANWERLEQAVANIFNIYGYEQIRTPMLEREELFLRPVGEHSDIVQKELYRFESTDKTLYCLRPEATVSTIRALAKANLLSKTTRVWYLGPMFRHERPQQGRLRQFHQFGAEILGNETYVADIEIIQLVTRLFNELGISKQIELQVNNLGHPNERKLYKQELTSYFGKFEDKLSATDQTRIKQNPLRILDSKDSNLTEILANAPQLEKFLSDKSKQHFDQVISGLDELGIKSTLNSRLVRGLDYYGLTVFEWIDLSLSDKRQNAVAGGGRYDGLTELIGADACPGIGFAAGIERILAMLEQKDTQQYKSQVFLATSLDGLELIDLLKIAESLRNEDISVITHPVKGKIRDLFKHADKSNASHAVIIGAKEVQAKSATIKPLRTNAEQQTVGLDNLAHTLEQMLTK